MSIDLAAYTADYVAMCDREGHTYSPREIAIAYLDAHEHELDGVAFDERVDELVAQIEYLLA